MDERRDRDLDVIREYFVDFVHSEYGTDEDGLRQFVSDMRWVAKQRRAYEGVGKYAFLIVIGAVVSGVLVAAWEGIKVLSRAHNGYP